MKRKTSPEKNDELTPNYGPEQFRGMNPNRFAAMDLKFKGGGPFTWMPTSPRCSTRPRR
jgi:hypothetical protein